MRGVGASAAALLFGPSALAQLALSKEPGKRNSLVILFLRGGADGLNIIAPYQEDAYYKLRPSLSLPGPRRGNKSDRVLDLDGFFGLHPAMSPLEGLFKEGEMACVHAVGSNDGTRSHFEAMAAMERGLPNMGVGASRTNGWLARYLNATESEDDSPLRALAISEVMPDTLRGAAGASNIREIGDFQLRGETAYRSAIEKAYATGSDAMAVAGRDTMTVLNTLDRLNYKSYAPSGGAKYPESDLGRGLKQVAFLLKAGVGLEVAFLDKDGWDTHVAQGSSTGWQASLIGDLSQSLRAFTDDIKAQVGTTSIVVMTEFGRRAYENSGLGTDHGRASVMFVIGGGVQGGKVYGDWPGLEGKALTGPGDLQVTTDYRNVLAEVLRKKQGLADPGVIFPGLKSHELGLWT